VYRAWFYSNKPVLTGSCIFGRRGEPFPAYMCKCIQYGQVMYCTADDWVGGGGGVVDEDRLNLQCSAPSPFCADFPRVGFMIY
jgi:hypothetical protein